MNRHLFILLFVLCGLTASAQTSIREVFANVPDSIFPTLTKNNRLDMMDFVEAQMRAEVINLLSGTSEMLSLSKDSLTIRMSEAQTLTMYLLPTEQAYDSLRQVVCIERTYKLSTDDASETVRELYSLKWRKLEQLEPADAGKLKALPASDILRRDDLLLNILEK